MDLNLATTAVILAVGGFLILWALRRDGRKTDNRGPVASVLLLVRNQAAIIEGFLRDAWRIVAGSGGDGLDVVVVDDASTDETPRILEQMARSLPAVKIAFWRPSSAGGSALELGYFLCKNRTIVVLHLKEADKAKELLRTLERFFTAAGRELRGLGEPGHRRVAGV